MIGFQFALSKIKHNYTHFHFPDRLFIHLLNGFFNLFFHFSGYNLPRFFEVEVCQFLDCNNFGNISDENSLNLSHITTTSNSFYNLSQNDINNCFNVTDVVKTPLRENDHYISVIFFTLEYLLMFSN